MTRSLIIVALGVLANAGAQEIPRGESAARPVAPASDGTNEDALAVKVADGYFRVALNEARQGDFLGASNDITQVLALRPRLAEAWRLRGEVRQSLDDLDGALADFNQALALNPKLAAAYVSRGVVKRINEDLAGALADFNQGLALKPDYAPAYFHRGVARGAGGDYDAAMEDYNKAIDLNPQYADCHRVRGMARAGLGDAAGALADVNTALDLNPRYALGYESRGVLRYGAQDFPGALADFRKFCELDQTRTEYYARFHIWLIRSRMGEAAPATAELRGYMQDHPARKREVWPAKIAHFLTGDLPEAELLQAADDPDAKKSRAHHCEAWFYAGSVRLLAGDPAGARKDFNRCVATQEKAYIEYLDAVAELKYLPAATHDASGNDKHLRIK